MRQAETSVPPETGLRTIRRVIATPADVWLGLRMIGWALVLPVLARLVPLPSLVRWLWRGRTPRRRAQDVGRVALLARTIYGRKRPLRDNCLARSLLTYRFLSESNADVRLVVAVRPGVEGHVWVTLHGQPVFEDAASLARFQPILVYGSEGRSERIDGVTDRR
jgi:hypothetical protein